MDYRRRKAIKEIACASANYLLLLPLIHQQGVMVMVACRLHLDTHHMGTHTHTHTQTTITEQSTQNYLWKLNLSRRSLTWPTSPFSHSVKLRTFFVQCKNAWGKWPWFQDEEKLDAFNKVAAYLCLLMDSCQVYDHNFTALSAILLEAVFPYVEIIINHCIDLNNITCKHNIYM